MTKSRDQLKNLFAKEEIEFSRNRGRLLLFFAVVLVPIFSGLDYFNAPAYFYYFLKLRLLDTLKNVIALLFLQYYKKLSLKAIHLLISIFCCSLSFMIAHMCQVLGGYSSPYFAGIMLVLTAMGFIMPWPTLYTILNCFLIYLGYVLLAYTPDSSLQDFVNNSYFLLAVMFMATVSTYIGNKSRFKELSLRQELKNKNERLLSLDQAKTRFFANLTHEFRTPLVSLNAALEMIQEKIKPDQELALLLHNSHVSLSEMLENINDLLAKAKSETTTLEMKWSPIDMIDFSKKALTGFQAIATQKQITLLFKNDLKTKEASHSSSYLIYGDPSKLKKILNNLLGNAIKFTHKGTIELSLSNNPQGLLLKVKDTGIGIPKEDLPHIFEPFNQASNNPLRDVKGTGLGLSIVKDFVEAHHGRIEVVSSLEKGTQFKIFLPPGKESISIQSIHSQNLKNQEIGEDIEDISERKFIENLWEPEKFKNLHSDKPHLLIVEDTVQVAQTLAFVLKEEYNLHFAKDGENALEVLNQEKIDLILSDIMMPNKNGYELLAELKQNPRHKNTPFILITSKTDLKSKILSFEQGADEYISKPFNNIEVRTRVKNLLERRRMEIEFVHSEKMIALGQLVAGISHEILNPISYAKNAAENIPDFLDAMEDGRLSATETKKHLKAAVASVADGIQRVCEIAGALKSFAGQNQETYQLQDIHQGIESTLKILHVQAVEKIQIHRQFGLQEKVECKLNQLNQVFLNLLINAVHVLQNQKAGNIWISTQRQGEMAEIIIQDDGPGINKEIQEKIFNPFFTTKEVGEGSGLGLYISQQIVHEHGGKLHAKSIAGKGSQLIILIPLKQKRGGAHDKRSNFTHPHITRNMAKVQYPHR